MGDKASKAADLEVWPVPPLAIAIVVPFQVPVPIVPTVVRLEVTTLEAKVVPVSVPAGATTAFVDAAVIRPLPLTVKLGIAVLDPKLPTFELTVASVKAAPEVVASPDRFAPAVARPLPVIVMAANVPILELTVAKVKATDPGPEAVPSPVNAVI